MGNTQTSVASSQFSSFVKTAQRAQLRLVVGNGCRTTRSTIMQSYCKINIRPDQTEHMFGDSVSFTAMTGSCSDVWVTNAVPSCSLAEAVTQSATANI